MLYLNKEINDAFSSLCSELSWLKENHPEKKQLIGLAEEWIYDQTATKNIEFIRETKNINTVKD